MHLEEPPNETPLPSFLSEWVKELNINNQIISVHEWFTAHLASPSSNQNPLFSNPFTRPWKDFFQQQQFSLDFNFSENFSNIVVPSWGSNSLDSFINWGTFKGEIKDLIIPLLLVLWCVFVIFGLLRLSLMGVRWSIALMCWVIVENWIFWDFVFLNDLIWRHDKETLFWTMLCASLIQIFQFLFLKPISTKIASRTKSSASFLPLSSLPLCQKCSSYLSPPIYITENGSFCNDCHDKSPKSPTLRNNDLEALFSSLSTTCPFAKGGCQEIIEALHLAEHMKVCPWRPFPCVFSGCSFTAQTGSLLSHHLSRAHNINGKSGKIGNTFNFQLQIPKVMSSENPRRDSFGVDGDSEVENEGDFEGGSCDKMISSEIFVKNDGESEMDMKEDVGNEGLFLIRLEKKESFLVKLSPKWRKERKEKKNKREKWGRERVCMVSVSQLSRVGEYRMVLGVSKRGGKRATFSGPVERFGGGGCNGLWFSLMGFGEEGRVGDGGVIVNLSLQIE